MIETQKPNAKKQHGRFALLLPHLAPFGFRGRYLVVHPHVEIAVILNQPNFTGD